MEKGAGSGRGTEVPCSQQVQMPKMEREEEDKEMKQNKRSLK